MIMKADNVLVKPEFWPTEKRGSIVVPDSAKKAFKRGVVIEVGPGPVLLFGGEHSPIEVKKGDHILYHSGGPIPLIVGGEEMHIVREREIIAVLEEGDFGTLPEGDSNGTT